MISREIWKKYGLVVFSKATTNTPSSNAKSCYYIPILINVCSKLQYAEILLIFLMSISYSVLSPLVIPFAVLYFAFGYVTWMNQLLFVYVPKWEGHGQMWPIIFHRYDMLQSF